MPGGEAACKLAGANFGKVPCGICMLLMASGPFADTGNREKGGGNAEPGRTLRSCSLWAQGSADDAEADSAAGACGWPPVDPQGGGEEINSRLRVSRSFRQIVTQKTTSAPRSRSPAGLRNGVRRRWLIYEVRGKLMEENRRRREPGAAARHDIREFRALCPASRWHKQFSLVRPAQRKGAWDAGARAHA